MRNILALVFSLFASVALAQSGSTVKQNGTITPGHAVEWTTNGVVQDAGTAYQGFLTSLGVMAAGNGICQISASVTQPYQRICLGATTAGGPAISIGNFGGASALPLGLPNANFTGAFYINGALPSGGIQTICESATGLLSYNCASGGGSSTLINGSTVTSGFTNNYVLTSNSNVLGQVIAATVVNSTACALGSSCTITVNANALTGTTLASGVTSSSLTSLGTLSGLTVSGTANFTGAVQIGGNAMTFPASPANLIYLSGPAINGDCPQFAGTAGALVDSGSPCGGGGGGGGSTAHRHDYVAASGDFTPGTTTSLTLSSSPVNANALTITWDGVVQSGNTWSLVGSTITFNAPIWSGVKVVDASWLSTSISVGTVTTVSVVSANGFAGTVATATSTPAITLSTTITGVLKGNGTAISAASAGTDYLAPTGSGAGLSNVVNSVADSGAGTITVAGTGAGPYTGAVTLLCTTATISQLGCVKPDNSTIGITAGVISVIGGGSGVTWPATADIVVSNSTNTPAGLAPVNGDCVVATGGAWAAGSCAGSAAVSSVGNYSADTSLTITGTGSGPWTANVTAKLNLSNAQTWAAVQKFTNSDICLLGSSTGCTTFTSANSGATAYTLTFPAVTDTLVTLAATQTLTNKSISGAQINSGTVAAARLPLGSSSALGVLQGDGSTTTINGSGVISCTTATTSQVGCVEPDGTTITISGGKISSVGGSGTSGSWGYGDGSDGNATISSGTTTLTRDMYYLNLTINGTGSIATSSYRIYVAGTLDISAAGVGAIQNNGKNGNTGTNGAVGSGGAGGTSTSGVTTTNLGGSPANTAGGGGGLGSAASNGSTPTAGAQGGATTAAGQGGTTTAHGTPATGGIAVPVTFVGTQYPSTPIGLVLNTASPPWTLVTQEAGGSGSSGGGGNGTNVSGAGGGGGAGGVGAGAIVIAANVIARGTNSTAGIIQAIGGNAGGGGNGYASGLTAGGGGGAAGAGGWVILLYGSLTGSTVTGAIDVSGGAGGAGGNGFGSGSTGGYGGGSAGTGTVQLYNIGASTLTTTTTIAGSSGSANSGLTGGAGGAANTKQVNL